MTTITKERIELFIKNPLENGLTRGEQMELARIALASLEAEPVAYIFKHPAGKLFWALTDESNKEQADVIPVYAAAPASVVPDNASEPLAYAYKELTPEIMRNHLAVFERYGIAPNDSITTIQALRIALDGIERSDAMLHGAEPVSQTYKLNEPSGNSPVTPDGWISCSERMPDKLIPVMVMYEDGEMWSAMWNGNRWDDGTEYPDPHSVTHWREMPAAPQQEVK
ncbi:putative phage protein [Escherichia coli]|nr:putative phage protein [Escherichia coli]